MFPGMALQLAFSVPTDQTGDELRGFGVDPLVDGLVADRGAAQELPDAAGYQLGRETVLELGNNVMLDPFIFQAWPHV